MANVTFPRKEFEKALGSKIDKYVEDKISLLGTPLESLSSNEVEIEIFPNRPDLLSMQGYIRAFRNFLGKEKGLKKYKVNKPERNYKVKVDKSVKSVRPFTTCAIVKGLKLDDKKIKEIINIQEKIHSTLGRNRRKLAIGIYPLDKIKLPITYKAVNPKEVRFTPLEARREMNGIQILKQHPKGKEYAHLLENCKKYPVFVDANGSVLSMPPIINSNELGKVNKQTRDVFVEFTGTDIGSLRKALNILVTMLADMGGDIYGIEVLNEKKEITPDLTPEKMIISLENTNKLLGLDLKERDLVSLLAKMGFNYKSGSVEIPAWRTDILHEVDLIEEVAIAYGYNNMIPEIPKIATVGGESKESKLRSKISDTLSGLQLLEISTYHLIKPGEGTKMRVNSGINVKDSKTEYKTLRPNLLIPALRILSENKDNEYPQRIYELGTVFTLNGKSETGIKETDNVFIALTPGNFTEIKQVLDYLMKMLGLDHTLKEATKPGLIDGRTGEVFFGGKAIGYLGEVHPNTLRAWNLKLPIAVLEISLEEIYKLV
jgi:phenylalanyl-tRNA synthetase beta chain